MCISLPTLVLPPVVSFGVRWSWLLSIQRSAFPVCQLHWWCNIRGRKHSHVPTDCEVSQERWDFTVNYVTYISLSTPHRPCTQTHTVTGISTSSSPNVFLPPGCLATWVTWHLIILYTNIVGSRQANSSWTPISSLRHTGRGLGGETVYVIMRGML